MFALSVFYIYSYIETGGQLKVKESLWESTILFHCMCLIYREFDE